VPEFLLDDSTHENKSCENRQVMLAHLCENPFAIAVGADSSCSPKQGGDFRSWVFATNPVYQF
jgi:hypothetical protein